MPQNNFFDLESQLGKSSSIKPGMPLVMGILNVTPDSFSDGGQFVEQALIEQRVVQMIEEGADIIDIGGESTRPGAEKVSLDVELQRVIPVVEWITQRFDVPVSIDTYKTEVMRQSIAAGAQIINDVNALHEPGAVELVADSGVTVCLMHKQGTPKDMQQAPSYADVVQEVMDYLLERVKVCESAGIKRSKIILDPGFGFGKSLTHNTELFAELSCFVETDYPVLVGVSRKKMIGEILNDALVENRIYGSVAAATLAGLKGAKVVRVHDVAATVESLKVTAHLL